MGVDGRPASLGVQCCAQQGASDKSERRTSSAPVRVVTSSSSDHALGPAAPLARTLKR